MESLQGLETGNFGENLSKVSGPNRRNSRFCGDDWWRRVRSPLSGRGGSTFARNLDHASRRFKPRISPAILWNLLLYRLNNASSDTISGRLRRLAIGAKT